jgi:hypothetical protein
VQWCRHVARRSTTIRCSSLDNSSSSRTSKRRSFTGVLGPRLHASSGLGLLRHTFKLLLNLR